MDELSKRAVNNVEMFEFGVIRNEFRGPTINAALKLLQDSGRISVMPLAGAKIRSGYFYIGETYYKDKDVRIQIEAT